MEGGNRTLLLIFTIFGMALFIPVQAMAKYTMALLLTGLVIRLWEWANRSCSAWIGAFAAGGSVLLLTAAGEIIQVRERAALWMGILESVFVCAMVMAAAPVLQRFLLEEAPDWRVGVTRREPEHGEKLQNYAKSFNGLSQIFSQMENFKGTFEQEEMGRMQQEITAKICISCRQSANCWQ